MYDHIMHLTIIIYDKEFKFSVHFHLVKCCALIRIFMYVMICCMLCTN